MQRINVDVGAYLAGTGAVNIASGAAETDVLMSTGARKRKHVRRQTRHCR